MLRLALHNLLFRRVATLLALAGLLAATLGFVFLAGTSRTTQAVVTGEIARVWESPYHLLVRPPGSQAELELAEGLVRPNFLTGLADGGITRAQLEQIRKVTGVSVAAPIAIAGFTDAMRGGMAIDLEPYLDDTAPIKLLRVRLDSITAEAGLSVYPGNVTYYILYAPDGEITTQDSTGPNATYIPPTMTVAGKTYSCGAAIWCMNDETAEEARRAVVGYPGVEPGHLSFWVSTGIPMVVAGIDPKAEADLVGLDSCVVDGRYLRPEDIPEERILERNPEWPTPVIPLLASSTSGLEEDVRVTVDEAPMPPALPPDIESWLAEVESQAWEERAAVEATADKLYTTTLAFTAELNYNLSGFRTPGDVRYLTIGQDHLAALPVPADLNVYGSSIPRSGGGQTATVEDLAPPEARDVWFRPLTLHDFRNVEGNHLNAWDIVGTFNPNCAAGFDPLTGFQLQAYAPASVRLPDGSMLGPSRNQAGYVNQPPLLLTTLDGAEYFADPDRYEGRPGEAFISAIRIRVSGVDEPGPASEAKLARVAADIHEATGLVVDIVVGSSARPIQVDLAVGKFGRPALTVSEGWAVKGVAVRFLQAVRFQDVAIFSLVLVVAGILVAQTAYLSVRGRRREFAVLRSLGWSQLQITLLVELEMLLLGIGAGGLALALGMPLAALLNVETAELQFFAVAPLSVLVAAISGLVPALAAGRGAAHDALVGPAPRRQIRLRSIDQLALSDLRHYRLREALLGATGVALGATLVGAITLIVLGFSGVLDTSVLGVYLSDRVRPFHLVIAGLTMAVASVAVAEVIASGYLEREADLAALRALGWPRSAVSRYLLDQALALGLVGGAVAAVMTVALATALGAAPANAVLSAAVAGIIAVVFCAIAVIGPLVYAYRRQPAAKLSGE